MDGQLRGPGIRDAQCTVSVDELGELPAAVEAAAYAIAAEAVANAVRHSGASRLMISACRGKDTVLVEVIDNGCGSSNKPPVEEGTAWPTGRMR